ncbi:ABC-2 family transporter protein [Patescibacteria group bacterium]|nr:ABC-2 family transporter protein [Patescibacteria group bacterium]
MSNFKLEKIPKTFNRYLTIWWFMSKNSFLSYIMHRAGLLGLFAGKILRFAFFFAFIFFLLGGTDTLAGYTFNQTIFFFLTFNLVDTISQFLYREVYRFRPLIVTGNFDLVLVKPVNALFRSLMGGADVIDLITIPPLIAAIVYVGVALDPTVIQTTLFILLVINGLIIATAFHIAVISLGIITLEIDHTIMIYRDLVNMGRLPVDIYRQPLQGALTYLIPVGIMITLPAKALMGLVSPVGVISGIALSGIAFFASLKFWNLALRRYTSASS